MKHVYASIIILCCILPSASTQSWNALCPGLNGAVYTIAIHNNEVYASGNFTNAGGDPDADYLARWDGTSWHAVAPGLIHGFGTLGIKGDLIYVGGNFQDLGGNQQTNNIAYWDGTEWRNLGNGVDYNVSSIVFIGNDVYAGGGFNIASSVPNTGLVARWDGTEWHALGSGAPFVAYDFTYVSDMATDGTNLYVTGLFENMGGVEKADRIARWDGSQWHALGDGINPNVMWTDWLQVELHQSDVYVSGAFKNAGGNPDADYIARWNGSEWEGNSTSLADSNVYNLVIQNDYLYCTVDDTIKRFDLNNKAWENFAIVPYMYTLVADSNNLFVGGIFTIIQGVPVFNIARWGEASTALSEIKTKKPLSLAVYPNPAFDLFEYKMEGIASGMHQVVVSDVNGKTVITVWTDKVQVDISSLPAGVYFIQISTKEKTGLAKLIKM